jgi:probable rRNA maturation factor
MILLDPDLDPDPSPKKNLAKRAGAPVLKTNSKIISRDVRLPSARTLARFLALAQKAVRLKGQVTVLLTTDAAIKRLNKQFRGKNKATDVLSFPASGPGAEEIAGDLAISVTTALGQAAELGHSLSTEIKVLVLHGLLHLAGYDHEVDDGAMARRELVLRAKLKLPQGLIERASQAEKASKKNSSGVRARTFPTVMKQQGLKPSNSGGPGSTRLKSGPFTKPSGLVTKPSSLVTKQSGSARKPSRSVRATRSALTPKAKTTAGKAEIAPKAKRP